MPTLLRRGLPVLIVAAGTVAALAAPAAAAPTSGGARVERDSFPIAGSTVTCDDGTTYTATAGIVRSVSVLHFLSDGGFSGTFTDVVRGGRATANGQTYKVVGVETGSGSGPNADEVTGSISFRLLILGPHGVVGKVFGVQTFSPDGPDSFVNHGGNCQPPVSPDE